MPTFWLEYSIFPVLLFFLSACLVTGLPLAAEFVHRRERGRQDLRLPETKQSEKAALAVAR
jgi:hypothetical protein